MPGFELADVDKLIWLMRLRNIAGATYHGTVSCRLKLARLCPVAHVVAGIVASNKAHQGFCLALFFGLQAGHVECACDVDARFGDGFADKVQAALVGMDDPELLDSFPRKAFVPAANEDYEPILETGRALGILD